MQVGRTERAGSKSEIKYFGKLPPHLLAHDVSAAAVSCHFGPQSSEAEVAPGSPLSLLLCSKTWFSLHCSKMHSTLLFCAWPRMAHFCFPLFLCILFGRRLKCFHCSVAETKYKWVCADLLRSNGLQTSVQTTSQSIMKNMPLTAKQDTLLWNI